MLLLISCAGEPLCDASYQRVGLLIQVCQVNGAFADFERRRRVTTSVHADPRHRTSISPARYLVERCYGVVDVAMGWPRRYSHSPAEVVDLKDVAGLADFIRAMAESS
jgi:hypothetical protein